LADAHGNHPTDFWEDLLRLIDAELEEPHTLVIVGGAAIGLRYKRAHLTTDMDSVTSTRNRGLWAAIERGCRRMKEQAGLEELPKVSSGSVFDPPEDWESRLRSLKRLKLKHLDVKLPERHDLAISKVSRGDTRDFEAIRAMHEEKPFLPPTLVKRYEEAHRVRVGDPRRFKMNSLSLASTLFGDAEADRVEPRLKT
jgi:hypothetical protein